MRAATLSMQQAVSMAPRFAARHTQDTIETRLWLEEHEWLVALLKSEQNVLPTFRCSDLISACVSLVFANDDASARINTASAAPCAATAPAWPAPGPCRYSRCNLPDAGLRRRAAGSRCDRRAPAFRAAPAKRD